MQRFRLPVAILVLTLIFGVFATSDARAPNQDPPVRPPAGGLSGQEINDNWSKAAVDILTFYKTDSDPEFHPMGSGSGTFIDEKGQALTACHVVKIPGDVIRRFAFKFNPDGTLEMQEMVIRIVEYRYELVSPSLNRRFNAKLVGWSEDADLATLKVEGIDRKDYYLGKIGNSDKVKIGETVYVLGRPVGISAVLTKGIVSQLHKRPGIGIIEDNIQVDAAVNRGNSGGPLVNEAGELIGIVNSKVFMAEGIGFAIPIKFYDPVRFSKGGEIKRPVIGVDALLENFPRWGTRNKPRQKDLNYLQTLTGFEGENDVEVLSALYQVSWEYSAIVKEVQKNSPADKAFKRGDLIGKVGGKEVHSGMDLRIALWSWDTAKPLEVEFLRPTSQGLNAIKATITFTPNPPSPAPPGNGSGGNPNQERLNPNPPPLPGPNKDDRLEKKKWS